MKIQYFFIFLGIFMLACTVSTIPNSGKAAANSVANEANQMPPARNSERAEAVKALGRLNIRSAPTTGADVLGWYEQGASVDVIGAVIETPEVLDCPRWYKVEWRGGAGYVCAGWVSK